MSRIHSELPSAILKFLPAYSRQPSAAKADFWQDWAAVHGQKYLSGFHDSYYPVYPALRSAHSRAYTNPNAYRRSSAGSDGTVPEGGDGTTPQAPETGTTTPPAGSTGEGTTPPAVTPPPADGGTNTPAAPPATAPPADGAGEEEPDD